MSRPLIAMLACLLAVAPAWADTYHTPLSPSHSGGISGVIKPKEGLQTVIALEPTDIKAYQAQIDAGTGSFSFKGLPPGEYDLLVKSVGKVYEGLTLEVEAQGEAPAPAGASTTAAAAAGGAATAPATAPATLARIRDEIATAYAHVENYFNHKRIVRLTGDAQQARMIVAQVRTLPVLDPNGDKINANIRRIDFVDLVKTRKVWQVRTNRHVLRQEVPYQSEDNQLQFVHSPRLAKILVGERMRDLGEIDLTKLPATPPGRYATAEFDAK